MNSVLRKAVRASGETVRFFGTKEMKTVLEQANGSALFGQMKAIRGLVSIPHSAKSHPARRDDRRFGADQRVNAPHRKQSILTDRTISAAPIGTDPRTCGNSSHRVTHNPGGRLSAKGKR